MNATGQNPNAITEGTVAGAPRRWLRLVVPGHHVGDSWLIGGRPPSALWRR
jgi:hypothetical protein